MLVLSEIMEYYDNLEKIVSNSNFYELLKKYNGYNLIDDEDKKMFDFEIENYIFTIKRNKKIKWTILCNDFQIFINDEWVDFKRW